MKRTKRDRESFHFTLNEYQLEMLDAILSASGIDPKSTDFKSDPLLFILYEFQKLTVRPQKTGPTPFAEKVILEAILTGALIELSTAFNGGTPLQTHVPFFTDQAKIPPLDPVHPSLKSTTIQTYFRGILDFALARAHPNATNPTSFDNQD